MKKGWQTLLGVAEARARFLAALDAALPGHPPAEGAVEATEEVPLDEALGRVTAGAVVSPVDVPHFARSRVDGFAVRAQDTYGASEALPAYLELAGSVSVAQAAAGLLRPGQAVAVATGAMLPRGADAVVMLEHAPALEATVAVPQPAGVDDGMAAAPRPAAAGDNAVAVLRPAAVGENVVAAGEDVARGAAVLGAGRRLRPQDVAALAATGQVRVRVRARPRVAVLSTGDELVPAWEAPGPGRVRDCNGPALAACVRRDGGEPWTLGIVADRRPDLEAALARALEADMVLLSGGSSVGERDLVAEVLDSLGPPGVLVHGVRVRPGKPTVLAVSRGRPVAGLPGHPVSALVSYELFCRPALERLAGLEPQAGGQVVRARLLERVPSAVGREDYARVCLEARGDGLWARPVPGGSALITSLVQADGLLRVPEALEGLEAGEEAEVLPCR